MRKKVWIIFILIVGILAGCQCDEDEERENLFQCTNKDNPTATTISATTTLVTNDGQSSNIGINSISLAENATNISTDTVIQVSFNTQMNSNTLSDSTFYLKNQATDSKVSGNLNYDSTTQIVTFTPDNDLEPSTTYVIYITTDFIAESGDRMDSDYTSSFTTEMKWVKLISENAPPARVLHTAEYDKQNNRMLVFGGANQSGYLNDLWEYNIVNNTWSQLTSGSSSRKDNASIYEQSNSRMIVFMGESSGDIPLDDVWKCCEWEQLNETNTPPSARYGHTAVIYASFSDSSNSLIFGGWDGSSRLNDIWDYNSRARAWTLYNPTNSPPARSNHSAVYDKHDVNMYIFGGSKTGVDRYNDLWKFNVSIHEWTEVFPIGTSPSIRYGHTAILDNKRRMIVVGGYNGLVLEDVYQYDIPSNTWIDITPSNKYKIYDHTAIYDETNNTILVFGGYNGTSVTNDLWKLKLN